MLERDSSHEVVDVDPAIAQRAPGLVGFSDLGGEGDDALESRLDLAHRLGRIVQAAGGERSLSAAHRAYACRRGKSPKASRLKRITAADAAGGMADVLMAGRGSCIEPHAPQASTLFCLLTARRPLH